MPRVALVLKREAIPAFVFLLAGISKDPRPLARSPLEHIINTLSRAGGAALPRGGVRRAVRLRHRPLGLPAGRGREFGRGRAQGAAEHPHDTLEK